MIHIAICDDETKVTAEIERNLMAIFDTIQVKCEIDVFLSGEALCRAMHTGIYFDLIFLDIEFAQDEINGVEVGRFIRNAQENHSISIVYISREKDYAFQLFEVRPLNFLIKPVTYEMLEKTVRTYLAIAGLWAGEFSYHIGRDAFKVRIKDIMYLESRDRKIILHFANGQVTEFYGSLKAIYQAQLQRFDFLFIHAAYAVNFDYISAISYSQLLLTNNTTPLPISQGRRNAVRESYYSIMKRRRV